MTNHWKNRVKNYSIKPSSAVWDKIEGELDKKDKKRSFLSTTNIFARMSVAASLLLAIGVGLYLWSSNNGSSSEIQNIENFANNSVKDNSEHDVINNDSSNAATSVLTNVVDGTNAPQFARNSSVSKDENENFAKQRHISIASKAVLSDSSPSSYTTIINTTPTNTISHNPINNIVSNDTAIIPSNIELAQLEKKGLKAVPISSDINAIALKSENITPRQKWISTFLNNNSDYTYSELFLNFVDWKAKETYQEKLQPAVTAYIENIGKN
ncbi:MAG: hypothetical protein KA010_02265 [Saprospiraceae bacterium]|nr:hypothetical protein [Saprospiraceae bacterium]